MITDEEFYPENNKQTDNPRSTLKAFWISNDTHTLFKMYCKKKGVKMMTQGDLIVLEFLDRESERPQ